MVHTYLYNLYIYIFFSPLIQTGWNFEIFLTTINVSGLELFFGGWNAAPEIMFIEVCNWESSPDWFVGFDRF